MFLGMLRRPSPRHNQAVAAAGLTAGGADFFHFLLRTGSGCFVSGSFCNAFVLFCSLFGSSVPIHAGSGSQNRGSDPLNPFRIIRVTNPFNKFTTDAASNLSASGWLILAARIIFLLRQR